MAESTVAFIDDGILNAINSTAQTLFFITDQAHNFLGGHWSAIGPPSVSASTINALQANENYYGNQGYYNTSSLAPVVRDNAISALGIVYGSARVPRPQIKTGFSSGPKSWAQPGDVSWVNGRPYYDPKNFYMHIDGSLKGIDKYAIKTHELVHYNQFRNNPWSVWYTQHILFPGRSIPMWRLERQAYKIEAGVRGKPYRFFDPLGSDNVHYAMIGDTIYFTFTAISGGAFILHVNK